VFAPKDVVMKHLTQNGDGFVVNIPASEVIEITGYLEPGTKYENNLDEDLQNAIKENIKRLTK
jgi:hypothetical protein